MNAGIETYSLDNSGSSFYPFLGWWFMIAIIIPFVSIFFPFFFFLLKVILSLCFFVSVFGQPTWSIYLFFLLFQVLTNNFAGNSLLSVTKSSMCEVILSPFDQISYYNNLIIFYYYYLLLLQFLWLFLVLLLYIAASSSTL